MAKSFYGWSPFQLHHKIEKIKPWSNHFKPCAKNLTMNIIKYQCLLNWNKSNCRNMKGLSSHKYKSNIKTKWFHSSDWVEKKHILYHLCQQLKFFFLSSSFETIWTLKNTNIFSLISIHFQASSSHGMVNHKWA